MPQGLRLVSGLIPAAARASVTQALMPWIGSAAVRVAAVGCSGSWRKRTMLSRRRLVGGSARGACAATATVATQCKRGDRRRKAQDGSPGQRGHRRPCRGRGGELRPSASTSVSVSARRWPGGQMHRRRSLRLLPWRPYATSAGGARAPRGRSHQLAIPGSGDRATCQLTPTSPGEAPASQGAARRQASRRGRGLTRARRRIRRRWRRGFVR